MKIIKYPSREQWADLIRRPQIDTTQLHATVSTILSEVKAHGDDAVRKYEEQFDHAQLHTLAVTEAEMEEAERLVSDDLKAAIYDCEVGQQVEAILYRRGQQYRLTLTLQEDIPNQN